MSQQPTVWRCKDCKSSRDPFFHDAKKVSCVNPKVFGDKGEDIDGASSADFHDEKVFGVNFGCVHFEPMSIPVV